MPDPLTVRTMVASRQEANFTPVGADLVYTRPLQLSYSLWHSTNNNTTSQNTTSFISVIFAFVMHSFTSHVDMFGLILILYYSMSVTLTQKRAILFTNSN